TELARRMVTQYGMSDTLGPIQYGRGNHQVFLGRDFGEDRNYSEEIAGKIDAEVRKIIDSCYADARKILEVNWDKVERMAGSLLEHETVEAEEVLAILAGKPWPPQQPELKPPTDAPLPPTGTLAGGVAYEVRADPAQPGAAVALWYRAPSSGFGAAPVPALSRLA